MYGGHLVIKAFNAEKRSIAVFEAYNAKLYGAAWSLAFISGLMMPLMSLVANLGYVVITVLGGASRSGRSITRGRHSGLHPVLDPFTQPLAQIASFSSVLQQTAAAAERVFEFLEEDEEVPDESEARRNGKAGRLRVEFEIFRFGFPQKT